MKKRKKLSNSKREGGMTPPSRAIKEFDSGEKVHINIDSSIHKGRPHPRFHGRTGEIVGKQGDAYKVRIKDKQKDKILIVKSNHLEKTN